MSHSLRTQVKSDQEFTVSCLLQGKQRAAPWRGNGVKFEDNHGVWLARSGLVPEELMDQVEDYFRLDYDALLSRDEQKWKVDPSTSCRLFFSNKTTSC